MAVALYMDEQVPLELTLQLRLRGVDVLTAQEVQMIGVADDAQLAKASSLGRVIYTQDRDFLAIAATWQREGRSFGGVIYAHPLYVSFSERFADLHLIAEAAHPSEYLNWIEHLPLRATVRT